MRFEVYLSLPTSLSQEKLVDLVGEEKTKTLLSGAESTVTRDAAFVTLH